MKTTNFSIVSYLLGEDFKVVRDLQKELSVVASSQKCLVDWLPHITVGSGIIVPEERLSEIEAKFLAFSREQRTITAKMSGFGGTDSWKGAVPDKISPYVLWLLVEVSEELQKLFDDLNQVIVSKEETWLPRIIKYDPHITVAFFDLSKEGYEKGLAYLSSTTIEREFVINHVALVECYGEGGLTSVERKKFYFN